MIVPSLPTQDLLNNKRFFWRHFFWSLCALLLWASCVPAHACDVCGCSMSGNYVGVLPMIQRNMIGIRGQYRTYQSEHLPSLSGTPLPISGDYFYSIDLWAKWRLGKKWQVMGYLPYTINTMKQEGMNRAQQGISDAQISAHYTFVESKDTAKSSYKHFLNIGAGLKLPTGKYRSDTLPPNMQTGTGTFDFPVFLQYSIRKGLWALNLEANARFNTINDQQYQFGDRYASALRLMYWGGNKQRYLLPNVGILAEYAEKDTKRNIAQIYTGGEAYWATAGISWFATRWVFQTSLDVPVGYQLSSGLVKAQPRFNLSLLYTIRPKTKVNIP